MLSTGRSTRVGPYAVLRVLGRGRASQVLLARGHDGRAVALKVARGADLAREHALLGELRHPHLLQAFAHGRSARGEWMAMEAAARTARGPVAPDVALGWLWQAASALAHLHARGWVHRDLKPANLLLRADGSLAIADLGSAVRCGDVPGAGLVGSAPYAAPEQLQGAPAAPAADVYSLGCVLHEWLTGQPPFPGQTLAELLAQHLAAPVPRLPSALADWQPLLDVLLAKSPARRPADGGAVLSWNAS